jgi:hypothetical protein
MASSPWATTMRQFRAAQVLPEPVSHVFGCRARLGSQFSEGGALTTLDRPDEFDEQTLPGSEMVDEHAVARPGRLGNGAQEAIVKQPRLPRARWRVTELEPGRSFTWQTGSGGLTTAGGHVVEANGQGSVITLTLRQHGPLARLVHALVGRRARRYLSMEIDGFRQTAESARG